MTTVRSQVGSQTASLIGTATQANGTRVLIETAEDLARYAGASRMFGFQRGRRVQLELDWLMPGESRTLETKINRLNSECGCGSGAVASIATIGGYGLAIASVAPALGWSIVRVGVVGVLVFFLAGAAGKVLGLVSAHRRLQRILRDLVAQSKREL